MKSVGHPLDLYFIIKFKEENSQIHNSAVLVVAVPPASVVVPVFPFVVQLRPDVEVALLAQLDRA